MILEPCYLVVAVAVGQQPAVVAVGVVGSEAHVVEEVLFELECRRRRLEQCHWAFVSYWDPHCRQIMSCNQKFTLKLGVRNSSY